MNPQLALLLKALAVGAQMQQDGLTDDLRAQWAALVAEIDDSILEPQDTGEPWTLEAIMRWKARHDALTGGLITRHEG